MKISAYTVGDINLASSRLRSFYLFYSSERYGVNVIQDLNIWQSIKCDYLHLQSCYKPKYIAQAILFRLLGKNVIFDVSDIPSRKIHFIFFLLAAIIANSVTVPVEHTRVFLGRYLNIRKINVISDVLDVHPNKIKDLNFIRNKESKGIFWTGHPGNLESIESFIQAERLREDYQLVVITKLNEIKHYKDSYPWVKFLEWNLDSVLDCNVDMGYALLNHTIDFKSENKMVLSIALGLIPIVSRTPAYMALAKELEADRLVFDNLSQVFDIIKNLDAVWVNDFKLRAKAYVLERYSSAAVFSFFSSKCLVK